ncbi:YqgE/AlgH family protein [Roseomonas sp. OT10]|uniref:YqgE/AlgH family protein n=1 Tax=Roseomonas cutis TaxID=2897332 RepID=UPI001E5A48B9|nr:YqgE/AlgH family protein [Roseomonas sp. OT10]UFN50331.1 YqgE/AlgH family protein [Roseomonas sp. OT10]
MARRPQDDPDPSLPEEKDSDHRRPSRRGGTRGRRPTSTIGATDQGGYLAGQILIAMPSMQDPRFARSVICVCAHSPDGAMGIVLNKPIENLSFDDLLKQLDVAPVPPARRIALHAGGPVEGGRGFVLHTSDWSSEGSLTVDPSLALTASVDILKAIATGGGPRRGLLALGYAGWGPGQLEHEIHGNAWLNVSPDEALLFEEEENDAKWRRALAKLRVDPLLLVGTAGRA